MKNNLTKRRAKAIVLDGETVAYMRSLTLGELRRVQADVAALPDDDEKNIIAMKMMLAVVLCDQEGNLVMTGHTDPTFEAIELDMLTHLFHRVTESQTGKR